MLLRFKIQSLLFIFSFVFSQAFPNFINANTYSENLLSKKDLIEQENLNNHKYILGTGDVLKISVQDFPEFDGEYQILNDGSIVFPLLGSIYISNYDVDLAKKKITERLSSELIFPVVFLSLVKTRPVSFSVLGEVKRPGIYTFNKNPGDPSIFPTLIDAIRKSGGITDKANLKEVTLIRKISGDKNEKKQAKINLIDMIVDGRNYQNSYLFDSDIIKVSRIKEETYSEAKLAVVKANLSPQSIFITVIGEVNNPGILKVNANTSMVQAILMAGGPISWKANKGNVELLRLNSNGSASLKKIRINLNQGLSEDKNPLLLDGDIIKVNKTLIANVSSGLGVVSEPVRDFVSVYTLFKIFND